MTGAAGLDSEVSLDGAAFADCTNEATEIATSSGVYYLDLTAGEMNADTVAIIVKTSTSGAKTTPIILYPKEAADVTVVLEDASLTATKIAADAFTAAKFAADVTTEFQSGLATAAALATVDTNVDSILADTDELQTDWANGGRLDLILDARASQTSVDTIDDFLDTEIAAILADTNELQTDWANGGRLDLLIDAIKAKTDLLVDPIRSNTAQAGAATTITLDASASATDDFYNNTLIVLTGGTGAGQARFITDYAGATKVATVAAWVTNPDNTSTFSILAFGAIPGATAPTAAEVRQEIDANSTQLAAIVADTNELQTDWVDGGRLDLILDARASQASVDTVDNFLDTEIASIISTLGTPAGASLAADIAAIEAQTDDIGVAGAGLTAVPWNAAWDAEVQSEVSDALTAYDPPTKAELDTAVDAIPTATENADALLNRDMSAVSDTNSRSPLNALRLLRNKHSISGGTLTVTEEDDTTTAWSAAVTTDDTADPITAVDPS